jgi:hypothetical protein
MLNHGAHMVATESCLARKPPESHWASAKLEPVSLLMLDRPMRWAGLAWEMASWSKDRWEHGFRLTSCHTPRHRSRTSSKYIYRLIICRIDHWLVGNQYMHMHRWVAQLSRRNYSLHLGFKGTFSKSLGSRLFLIGASLLLHLTHVHAKNDFTPNLCMKLMVGKRKCGRRGKIMPSN